MTAMVDTCEKASKICVDQKSELESDDIIGQIC